MRAIILDKNGHMHGPELGYEITSDDFEEVEDQAKSYDFPVCIRWHRNSDGQTAYWSPRGASLKPHWYNSRGGAMPGAGRPEKPEQLKKRQIGVQLPEWVIAKLDEIDEPRQAIIEQALIDKFGWEPPDID